jgi:hypothetical protein
MGFLLTGCAGIVVFGIPATFVTTEVVPRAVNGKGLIEDGVDVVTGKDCRVIEGTVRKDRQTCEPKGSPETKKDFKGLLGLADDDSPND